MTKNATFTFMSFKGMALSVKDTISASGYTFIETLAPNRDLVSVAAEIGEVMTSPHGMLARS
jgi:hypothetical protein